MTWSLHLGDVLEVARRLEPASFDAVLCDPPYGLRFMGKRWDYDVPSPEVWAALLAALKPGGHVVAFGGTRTFHRLTVAMEDGGLEIRDVLAWLYGSGFPKSLNVSKAIEAQQLTGGSSPRNLADAVDATGQGAPAGGRRGLKWADDGTKQGVPRHAPGNWCATVPEAAAWDGYGTALKPAWEPAILARKPLDGTVAANVAKWGVGALAIDACRLERAPDDVSGYSKTGSKAAGNVAMGRQYDREPKPDDSGRWPANVALDEDAAALLDAAVGNDGDGPSRFFYTAKVSTSEREFGCRQPNGGTRNVHPTLKPVALTTWLARLLMPPGGGRILVPFSGAGSEMIGALRAGWGEVVGIERDPEYVAIARARLERWQEVRPDLDPEEVREAEEDERQGTLFGRAG